MSRPNRFVTWLRRVVGCAMLLALPVLSAQTTTGTVTGVVTDPQGSYLQGAEVGIKGTALTAITDRTGRFRINGVPAGSHEIIVSYLGYDSYSASITTSSGTTEHQVSLQSDVIVLDEFVVESIAEGQARAINRQRASGTISNMVASDAMGRLPDASVGEALARLPGISVQNDRGEPEFITVRGAGPKFNSVTLNGDRIPSVSDPTEERDDRAVSLNTVPTDLIAGIEVTKAVTPDMDADAVGASVNLLTKSSLDFTRRVLAGKLEYGYNDIRDSDQYSGNFTFGDRFADGRVGLLFSGSYQLNNRGIDAINAEYTTATIGGVAYDDVLAEMDLRHRYLDRVRKGVSGQLDFRTGPESTLYVRGFFNQFEDREQRRRARLRFGSGGTYLSGTTNTTGVADGGRVVRRDRNGVKQTNILSIGAGGKLDKERFKLDYAISFADAAFKIRRTETDWEYRMSDYSGSNGRLDRDGVADWTYDRTNVDFPTFTDPLGHLTNYARQEMGNRGTYGVRDDDNSEEDLNAALNLTIPTSFGENKGAWKFGLKFRGKDKDSQPHGETYEWDGAGEQTLSNFVDPDETARIFDRYSVGPTTDMVKFRDFFFANRASFAFDSDAFTEDNAPGTYTAQEDIISGYAMASADIGRVHLIGGLRYEMTRSTYNANVLQFNDDGDIVGVTPVSDSNDYNNVFPGMIATWRLRDKILLRAAWTNTIARPDYGALTPRRIVNDEDEEILEGNPSLKPLKSMNWDVSFEWYLESAGIFSVGAFYKDIEDFTYSDVSTISGGLYDGYQLTRPENGPTGSIRGLEVAWSQTFRNLPAPFNGLGIQANFALVEGKSEVLGRGEVDFIPDQVDKVYNLQVYYERYPFSARVAYNFNGEYNDAIGAVPMEDLWFDDVESVDASLGWTIRPGWQLYLDGKNLADTQKKRIYQGRPDRPIEQEFSGWSVVGGIKFEF